jgi:hypothetical protein
VTLLGFGIVGAVTVTNVDVAAWPEGFGVAGFGVASGRLWDCISMLDSIGPAEALFPDTIVDLNINAIMKAKNRILQNEDMLSVFT